MIGKFCPWFEFFYDLIVYFVLFSLYCYVIKYSLVEVSYDSDGEHLKSYR